MHITEQKLHTLLMASDIIDEKAFISAKEESSRMGQSLVNTLIGRGDITEEYLIEVLEPYFAAPIVDLRELTIPSEVIERIPEGYAKAKNVIVFEYDEKTKTAKIAMQDPLDYDTVEFLRAKLGAWVEPHFTIPASLKYGLRQYTRKVGMEFHQIITENVEKLVAEGGETNLARRAEAVPIVAILDNIVEHAIALGASDIHFEPLAKELLVRYRVDGILQEVLTLQKDIEPVLVARVKILAGLAIDEHRIPQDGRFHFELVDGSVTDIRVNIIAVMHGEKVEMRLLKSSARPFTLEELGLSHGSVAIISEEIQKTHGMILVTGPTGHGKTTTLYAILHILNTPKVNITTIEDPIEYEISMVNQTQVNLKAGITFANGLRALLRQNPDIIMVGEIRDKETVEIAVHAALTGHLVLSSLHTNDAPSAVPRLLDMGAQAFLLASTVNVVVAQRLVRRICSSCVTSYRITPEVERLVKAQIALSGNEHIKEVPTSLFRGAGCRVCNQSGFRGQVGIFELLRVTDTLRNLILRQAPSTEIKKQAIQEGMVTMFHDGLQKVESGVTTMEEILRVVQE